MELVNSLASNYSAHKDQYNLYIVYVIFAVITLIAASAFISNATLIAVTLLAIIPMYIGLKVLWISSKAIITALFIITALILLL